MQLAWGFGPTHVLSTALELDVFTLVASGRASLSEIAAANGASARGLRNLLNALVGFGLLTRSGDGDAARFANSPDAEAFLVKGRPAYRGDFITFHSELHLRHWSRLTESVRSGKPVLAVDDPAQGLPFWEKLVGGLFGTNYPAARAVGEELRRVHGDGPLRVLDVAAGSGVWGIGVAHVAPNARVTAFDLAGTLELTRPIAAREQVQDRVELMPGDIRQDDFGSGYDAVILGHICHSEGAAQTRALLAKCARAIRPGGTLAIAEFLVDDDRRGTPQGLLFALNMLLLTTDGDTFSLAEFRQWLAQAGFRDVRTLAAPAPSPIILATRN